VIEVRFDKRCPVSAAWVRRVIAGTLKAERSRMEIGVLITGDRQIRKINKRFLKHDFATDVISFGLDGAGHRGDIALSVDTARRMAKELKIPFREELARYLIHGTLHLLGYNDKKKKDHQRMHERQEEMLTVTSLT
jgi:probable rRNA maturation factor